MERRKVCAFVPDRSICLTHRHFGPGQPVNLLDGTGVVTHGKEYLRTQVRYQHIMRVIEPPNRGCSHLSQPFALHVPNVCIGKVCAFGYERGIEPRLYLCEVFRRLDTSRRAMVQTYHHDIPMIFVVEPVEAVEIPRILCVLERLVQAPVGVV